MRTLIVICLLVLSGCYKYSGTMEESGTVEDTIFAPARHGVGVGTSTSGDLAVVSTDVPAVYAVVFRCPHGKFVVQGSGDRYRVLWSKLKKDTPVRIMYRERYLKSSGAFVGLDFLDAQSTEF